MIFLAVMTVSTKNKKEGIIIRFVIPVVFINKLDWSVCTLSNTTLFDGKVYRIKSATLYMFYMITVM